MKLSLLPLKEPGFRAALPGQKGLFRVPGQADHSPFILAAGGLGGTVKRMFHGLRFKPLLKSYSELMFGPGFTGLPHPQ